MIPARIGGAGRLPNAFYRKGRTRLSTFIATAFPIRTNMHAASTAKTRRGFACWWDAPIRTAQSTLGIAKQIKAVADKQYPGLVKDIFIGKGTYNQDLAPHAILLEFGTHTISKERVLNSTEMMAKVVSNTLYGPQTGSAISEKSAKGTSDIQKSAAKDDKGVSGGVIFLIVAVVAGVLIFALAQTGGGKAMGEKIGRNISEMTGGLFGRKPKDGNG